MKTLHRAALPVVGIFAIFALSSCSLISPAPAETTASSETPAAPAVTVDDLNDTTWTGTDSAGTATTFTFHKGGSTAVTFGGNSFDDPADTWSLDGDNLEISIKNVAEVGDATYVGNVTDPAGPIDLDLTFTLDDSARTITLTR